MWEGINRRRFPRVHYPCKIVIFKKGSRQKFSTHTENIGRGGICVSLKKELARFSFVELVLSLGEDETSIECDGRVVWVVKSKDSFDIGIEFSDIKDTDIARIERIVQKCLKQDPTSSEAK